MAARMTSSAASRSRQKVRTLPSPLSADGAMGSIESVSKKRRSDRSRRRSGGARPEEHEDAGGEDRLLELLPEEEAQAGLRSVEPDLEALGLERPLEAACRRRVRRGVADERVHRGRFSRIVRT